METVFEDTGIQQNRIKVWRRGEVSMEMTASDLISVAVNVGQNGWRQDESLVEGETPVFAKLSGALLRELFQRIIEANRVAVEALGRKER